MLLGVKMKPTPKQVNVVQTAIELHHMRMNNRTPPYSVRNAITQMRMTAINYATFEEAEKHAVRLSLNSKHTVEVWFEQVFVTWYYKGGLGRERSNASELTDMRLLGMRVSGGAA